MAKIPRKRTRLRRSRFPKLKRPPVDLVVDKRLWKQPHVLVDPQDIEITDLVKYRTGLRATPWPCIVCGRRLVGGYRRLEIFKTRKRPVKVIQIDETTNEEMLKLIHLRDALLHEGMPFIDRAKALVETYGDVHPRIIERQLKYPRYMSQALQKLYFKPHLQRLIDRYAPRLTDMSFAIYMQLKKDTLRKYYLEQCSKRVKTGFYQRPIEHIDKMMIKSMKEIGYANPISRTLLWCIYALPDEDFERDIAELKQEYAALASTEHRPPEAES